MTHFQAMTARVLLGWSFENLAKASNVPISSIYLLARLGSAGVEHDARICAALEAAGIEFNAAVPGGVRLRNTGSAADGRSPAPAEAESAALVQQADRLQELLEEVRQLRAAVFNTALREQLAAQHGIRGPALSSKQGGLAG